MSSSSTLVPNVQESAADEAADGWHSSRLEQFIKIKHGYAFSGEGITSEETANILVTPGNFQLGGGFKSSKFKYFSGTTPVGYRLKEGDIVVTMTDLSKDGDTLGYGAKIPASKGKTYLHNQRIGLVEFTSEEADKDFLYWVLRTAEYQGFVLGAATGTSVRHTSPSTIQQYKFFLPKKTGEQKAIAAVLTKLDDKIDLLQRQNQTLEAIAETLFRQWFEHDASVDWPEGFVEDLFVLQRGFDLPVQDRTDGPYPVVSSSGFSGSHAAYKVEAPGVTTGRSGLIGKVFLVQDHFWPLNTSLYVKEFRRGTPLFSYCFMKTMDLPAFNAGSAVPTLNRNHVHAQRVPLPPRELIERFDATAWPLFHKTRHNEQQMTQLEKLRDNLLPKFMTGEVRVAF